MQVKQLNYSFKKEKQEIICKRRLSPIDNSIICSNAMYRSLFIMK